MITGQDLILACSAIGAGLALIAGVGPEMCIRDSVYLENMDDYAIAGVKYTTNNENVICLLYTSRCV